jgi:hypothetical protein
MYSAVLTYAFGQEGNTFSIFSSTGEFLSDFLKVKFLFFYSK